LEDLKTVVQQKAFYAVGLQSSSNSVRRLKDEERHAPVVKAFTASQTGDSASHDNDICIHGLYLLSPAIPQGHPSHGFNLLQVIPLKGIKSKNNPELAGQDRCPVVEPCSVFRTTGFFNT
jgi:hypothetical protein